MRQLNSTACKSVDSGDTDILHAAIHIPTPTHNISIVIHKQFAIYNCKENMVLCNILSSNTIKLPKNLHVNVEIDRAAQT